MSKVCLPSKIFGKFDRHLFLGCSILDISLQTGWNENGSQVSVTLVEDPCGDTDGKIYYDSSLTQQTTTEADPGFKRGGQYPLIGSPVYLRLGDFEWAGLLQSWRESNSESGKPIYQVQLTDPRTILENAELVIGDYQGSVFNLYNLINTYGYMETFGVNCPETVIGGSTFGSPSGGFGGAKKNDNGIQFNRLELAVSLLTSSLPRLINQFSPYGRLIFKGAHPDSDGYGNMEADFFDPSTVVNFPNHFGYFAEYFVDLSELPVMPSYYRIPGTHITLMNLISQVCFDAGCDYYIELIPVKVMNQVWKIIKVRVVSRAIQPDLGSIGDFISQLEEGTISNSQGRELRNEITSSMIIGGNRHMIYQAEQDRFEDPPACDNIPKPDPCTPCEAQDTSDDVIMPYWGLDSNNDAIISTKDEDCEWLISVELTLLNTMLYSPLTIGLAELTEGELRTALVGPEEWLSFATSMKTDLGAAIELNYEKIGVWDLKHIEGLIAAAVGGIAGAAMFGMDIPHSGKGVEISKEDKRAKDIEMIYKFVLTYAEEFYGKKFMVRIPYTCFATDDESGNILTTEEPTDAGWTETNHIIELAHPSIYTDFFNIEDGRTRCFVRFDNAEDYDYSNLSDDDYVISGGNLFVKAELEPYFVYLDKLSLLSPRVVITLSQAIMKKEDPDDFRVAISATEYIFEKKSEEVADVAKANMRALVKNLTNQDANFGMERKAEVPWAAAVPLRSTIATYGPWVIRGPAGAVNTEKDDGLVPWEYGSIATMDVAGQAKVNQTVTFMQTGEMGQVTVPGYPDIPLGAEIGAKAGGVFGGGQNLLETRDAILNNFSEDGTDLTYGQVELGQWTGVYGPNITGINVEMGEQGVQTTYSFRTFSPKFGVLSKQNAERIKKIGRLNLRRQRELRAHLLLIRRLQEGRERSEDARKHLFRKPRKADTTSPVEVLTGQTLEWGSSNDLRRSAASLNKITELHAEYENLFNEKAFMSLDGLVRPVSYLGDGGLPRFSLFYSHCMQWQARDPEGPRIDYSPMDITQDGTYPFYGPSSPNMPGGGSVGHDIQILGRAESPPPSSIIIPIDVEASGNPQEVYPNDDDYRFLALRGPLIIQGWGYNLQGKPLPNAVDSDEQAAAGTFANTGQKDTFLQDWLQKSHTWPMGPVDLRFDQKRGVWVCPPSMRMVVATLSAALDAGTCATAVVTDGPDLFDQDGNLVTPDTISVCEVLGCDHKNGAKIIAYYDTHNCTWKAVGGCPEDHTGLMTVEGAGCLQGAVSAFNTSKIIFGSGLQLSGGAAAAQVDNEMEWAPTAGCIAATAGSAFNAYHVNVGKGLSLADAGACQADLGLDFQMEMISDCFAQSQSDIGASTQVTKLYVNDRGLAVSSTGTCEAVLSLDFLVNGQPVDTINTTGCLHAEVSNCKAEIGFDLQDMITGDCCIDVENSGTCGVVIKWERECILGDSCITVSPTGSCQVLIELEKTLNPSGAETTLVCDVICVSGTGGDDSGQLIVYKQKLEFNSCGLLTNIGPCTSGDVNEV